MRVLSDSTVLVHAALETLAALGSSARPQKAYCGAQGSKKTIGLSSGRLADGAYSKRSGGGLLPQASGSGFCPSSSVDHVDNKKYHQLTTWLTKTYAVCICESKHAWT